MGTFRFSDSIEAFHETASKSRGLENFGADDYSEALRVLCHSLDHDASLTPIGEMAIRAMITGSLEARLLVEEGHRRHPEATNTPIDRPLIIIGLPRTGTTALHHLIAQDPHVQALEHWLHRTPKPRPPRDAWKDDPDFQAAAARVDMMFARSPQMRAIHEIEAHLPDECWNTFSQNFVHSSYEANADVREYAAWWANCDMRPVYERHRRTAQLIGSSSTEKQWIFKDATHLFAADALFEVYPDALVVQTHRDPVPMIASVCSLCWSARQALNAETNIHQFGQSTLALWERSIYTMMDVRADRDPAQFFDIAFHRFVRDPVRSIREIYAHFDLPYTESADQAIQTFRADNPKGQHGKHAYRLEEYGLTEGEVRERFERYTTTYQAFCGDST